MNITRDMIISAGVCDDGLRYFDEGFPSGEGSFKDVYKFAATKDTPESSMNAGFILSMKSDPNVWLRSGKATMNEKYQVFDPLTGSHTQYSTLEEAKAARQVAIDAYVQHNIALFPVSQEVITDEGNSLWNPLTEEQLAQ